MNRYKITLIASLLAGLLPLQACATTLSSDPIQGQVLEESTNKPISNAIVVVMWKGTIGTLGHGRTICYHVETTTTNDQGSYQTQAWKKPSPYGDIANRHWIASAYKSGYESVRYGDRSMVRLKPFSGGHGERLGYLERVQQSARVCRSQEAEEKNLLPLYRALYQEANRFAQSKEGREVADGFLAGIEIIELGYYEGQRRAIERAEKRR